MYMYINLYVHSGFFQWNFYRVKELEKTSKSRGKPSGMNLVTVDRKRSDVEAASSAPKRTSPKVTPTRSPGHKRPASRARSNVTATAPPVHIEPCTQSTQALPQQKARAAAEARLAAAMAQKEQKQVPLAGIMYASTPKKGDGSPEREASPIDVSKILKDGESPLRGHRYTRFVGFPKKFC